MTSDDVVKRIDSDVNGKWNESNLHKIDIRQCLVTPRPIKIIHRLVKDGRINERLMDVWLVLQERSNEDDGYIIVFDEESGKFGLGSPGWPSDAHPSLCGLYGDFMTTFKAM
jgi:hypothetical protein